MLEGWSVLAPEVAGGWGERTVADTSTHPPRVTALHYQFDGWLGDELLESFPCYIVTRRLAHALTAAGLSGFNWPRSRCPRPSCSRNCTPAAGCPRSLGCRSAGWPAGTISGCRRVHGWSCRTGRSV